jgi:hypothetical protein
MNERSEFKLIPEDGRYNVDGQQCSSPSVAIATAVELLSESDAIAPLYEYIEPDALDSLFGDLDDNTPQGHIAFRCEDFRITVETNGVIRVVTDTPAGERRQNEPKDLAE